MNTSSSSKGQILLVEDDRDFAESLVDLLEPAGFRVLTASSLRSAQDASQNQTIDLALIDIRLGQQNGVELVPLLRERNPRVLCVLMTAYASLDSAMDALRHGALDYLAKPIDPQQLLARLDSALNERDLRERAERQQRLALLGETCARMAHDVNNLLQAVLAELALLDPNFAGMAPTHGELSAGTEGIRRTVNSIAGLCSRVLAFAKGVPLDSGCDAALTLASHIPSLCKVLPRNIRLDWSAPEHPVPIALDAVQLGQILMNLVLNARHAIRGDGSIGVSLSVVGASACLLVSDTGSGIPDATLPRIFDPYFSTKPSNEGSGLGLSIVYGMVTAVGGRIDVQTQLGQGTRFELLLPLRNSAR